MMVVQKTILKYEPKQENLLPAAKEVQDELGFLSPEAIDIMADYFKMKSVAVFSALSFYSDINIKQPAQLVIRICDSSHCILKSADEIISAIENFFQQKVNDDFNPQVEIKRESCFGLCGSGPIMKINETIFEKVTPEKVDEILRNYTDTGVRNGKKEKGRWI